MTTNNTQRDPGDVAMDLCEEYFDFAGRILTEGELDLLMMDAGKYVH
jgi:hypothetical protein